MDQAGELRAMAMKNGTGERAKIISITSGKGGVGKTNIATNLAVAFAKRGLRTLLIDADLGLANANLLLGCRVTYTLDDVLFGDVPIDDIFVKTDFGFDLLPGSSGVRKLLELDSFSQRALMDRLFAAMNNFDVVLYDTAPGIGAHVLNFNSSADEIVVVSHPEPTALADAYALIKVLATERKEKNFRLLVNRVRSLQDGIDSFRRIPGVSDEFLNISIDFLGSLPEDNSVLHSVQIQKPVGAGFPKSSFCVALDRVADKLLMTTRRGVQKNSWNNVLSEKVSGGGAV